MFKIGDFSKICQVSIKSLRHWDELGLLKPNRIDPFTSYRYYSIDQLEQVNRIIAFRELGLSLNQIGRLLQEQLSASDIRGMLRLKQAELQQQIEESQARLKLVEYRLRQIEFEGSLSQYEVVLKPVEAQHLIAIRECTPDMNTLVDLLRETHEIRVQNKHLGLHVAVFHDEGYDREDIDVEVGFAVDANFDARLTLSNNRKMSVCELSGVEMMACLVHRGSWLVLPEGYMSLGRWIDQQGYQIVGAGREIFHHIGWDDEFQSNVTELQFPVTKVTDS
jgi:DNA-binding transcriptional MerR regulator